MDAFLTAAGILAFLLGAVHSILGEVLIFRSLRDGSWIPTRRSPPLRQRHIRILWASWHVVTIFGWAVGAILLRLAVPSPLESTRRMIEASISVSMFAASLLVLVATRGRHPGWVVLLAIGLLTAW